MSEADSFTTLLKEVRDGLSSLSTRVASLEDRNTFGGSATGFSRGFSLDHNYGATRAPPASSDPTSIDTQSVESDYQRIKASVQSFRLPAELSLQEARQGIKREDIPMFNVLAKSARFSETILKLCAQATEDNQLQAEEVFSVACASIKYLQDEYAALVVNSSFDPNVSKLFRALQKNTGFSQETMEQLKNAATIASAYRPQQSARGRGGRGRGLYRGGGDNRGGRFAFPRRGGTGGGGDNQPSQDA